MVILDIQEIEKNEKYTCENDCFYCSKGGMKLNFETDLSKINLNNYRERIFSLHDKSSKHFNSTLK